MRHDRTGLILRVLQNGDGIMVTFLNRDLKFSLHVEKQS